MIRTKNKILGEVNDRNTVISETKLKPNKYIVSTQEDSLDYRIVKEADFGPKKILYSKDNKLTSLNYNVPNRYVGTDENGQLAMINKSSIILDIEAPEGRELLYELYGSNIPSNQLNEGNYLIAEPGWYEVEVSGAGGGAGSSVAYTNELISFIAKGGKGGRGGYYKLIIKITKPNTVINLFPGNAGGGAEGFKVYKTGKSVQIDGQSRGGDGGRNFKIAGYTGKGNSGENVERGIILPQAYHKYRSNGGMGINGGPYGGFSSIENSTYYGLRQGAGGGGASGPYGGKGGNCYNQITIPTDTCSSGGGGGAGGSFGNGGDGGRRDLRDRYGGFGYGYGGAGGGAGANSTDAVGSTDLDKLKGSPYSGAGGGGGGGTRLFIPTLDIEILTGGGGGGAGGALTLSTSTLSYVGDGEDGINNIDNLTNILGSKGGESGESVNINDTSNIPEGKSLAINMSGKNGEPGYVRIYKCI